VSSEHTPDDAVFKNQTLANKELVDILSEEVLGSEEGELMKRGCSSAGAETSFEIKTPTMLV